MPREVSADLGPLLNLDGCYTQSTLSLYPVTGDPVHMATDKFSFGGVDYPSDLVRVDEIQQSLGAATDRLGALAQNVTQSFGISVANEEVVKAEAIVGRYYRDPEDSNRQAWVELFRGEVIPLELTDGSVKMEIVDELVAAGFCVADWTLAENCQLRYKEAGTCGYAGPLPTCNKRRKSLGGCFGRSNEHHFGGMEFPEPQTPDPPRGGGDEPIGPGFPTCPRLDQWIRIRGRGYQPIAKQVGELKDTDEIYHPIWKTFHEIDSLTIARSQPIWTIGTENGGRGFSSFSHPVLWYREHANGVAVERFMAGDPVLTWSNALVDTKCSHSADLEELGDVMKIEMADGHIYCYADKPEGPYIVCHNAKPWDGGYVN